MPTSLLTEAPTIPSRWRRVSRAAGRSLAVVSCVALSTLLFRALEGPAFVDEITIVNATEYSVNVAVSSGDEGVLGLGISPREDERTFRQVIDQGETWVVQFSYAGDWIGEVTVDRAGLVDTEWRVEVPADIGGALAQRGFAPSVEGG